MLGWSPARAPAPSETQLHSLVQNAATQARAFLIDGTPLPCAMADDALRLVGLVPGVRLPDVADLRARRHSEPPE